MIFDCPPKNKSVQLRKFLNSFRYKSADLNKSLSLLQCKFVQKPEKVLSWSPSLRQGCMVIIPNWFTVYVPHSTLYWGRLWRPFPECKEKLLMLFSKVIPLKLKDSGFPSPYWSWRSFYEPWTVRDSPRHNPKYDEVICVHYSALFFQR